MKCSIVAIAIFSMIAAPARAANRLASSSPLSAVTVIALIFTTLIAPILPGNRPGGAGTPAPAVGRRPRPGTPVNIPAVPRLAARP